MTEISIYEVGPRDGLQNEKNPVVTDTKISFINMLSDTGLKYIECGAFVSPKWVPAMADSNEVLTNIKRKNDISYPVLAPNLKGLEGAIEISADTVCVFSTPSETFSKLLRPAATVVLAKSAPRTSVSVPSPASTVSVN